MNYSKLRDLTREEGEQALLAAESHVFRQQHEGSHEQGRWDAMAWMEKYSKHGRDKCAKCERAWKAGDPSKRGES